MGLFLFVLTSRDRKDWSSHGRQSFRVVCTGRVDCTCTSGLALVPARSLILIERQKRLLVDGRDVMGVTLVGCLYGGGADPLPAPRPKGFPDRGMIWGFQSGDRVHHPGMVRAGGRTRGLATRGSSWTCFAPSLRQFNVMVGRKSSPMKLLRVMKNHLGIE